MFTQPSPRVRAVEGNQMLRNALRRYLTDTAERCVKQNGINVSKFVNPHTAADILRDLGAFPDLVTYQRELDLQLWGRGRHIVAVLNTHVYPLLDQVRTSFKTSPTARYLGMDVISRKDFSLFFLNELLNQAELENAGWVNF